MRYTQDSGVRRKGDSDEYRVVVSVYLTPEERDLWGAGKIRLALDLAGKGNANTPASPRQPPGPIETPMMTFNGPPGERMRP